MSKTVVGEVKVTAVVTRGRADSTTIECTGRGSSTRSISLFTRVVRVIADEAQVYILMDGKAKGRRTSRGRKYACNIEGISICNT